MKKLRYFVYILFLSFIFISSKNVSALQFLDGTSFYDQKSPTSNTWTRSKYPAPDCTKTYCQFIGSPGLNVSTDYYAFEANVNNDFVKQKSDKFSFDYKIGLTYSTPSIQPNFTLDPTTAIVHIAPLGVSTNSSCTTNYSDITSEGATVNGHCVVEYEVGYSAFDKFFMSWRSKDMQTSPSSFPVLSYNPNKAIYITFTTATSLSNFKFSASGETDLSGVEKGIDEVNKNLEETNKKIDETNKKLDDTNKNLDNIDKTLNDSDTTDSENKAADFFNGFSTDTYGLTDIITAPLNTIKSITSSTCIPLKLPLPFVKKDLTIPCIRSIFEEHFNPILLIYQVVTSGFIAYWIIVRFLNLIKDFKNPDHDEIEVLDL